MNEKGCIQLYELTVYPMTLVVIIGDMEEEVNRDFKPCNERYGTIKGPLEFHPAATYRLKEKSTGDACIAIWMSSTDNCRASYMAHESSHAAMEVFKYIGAAVDFDNQEPFAYLLGTIMRLTNKTFYDYVNFLRKKPVAPKKKETKKKKTK